jgi:hypothetical protein
MILAQVDWAAALTAWSTLAATIVQGVALFVALLVLIFTYHQVRGVKDTLQLTALSGIVQIETYISDRKAKLDEASTEAHPETKPTDYQAAKKTALENWLNSVDRLCFVIRKGYWQDVDWRVEYESYLKGIIDGFPEFVNNTADYPHILALYNQWRQPPPKAPFPCKKWLGFALMGLGILLIVLVLVKGACWLFGWPQFL